MWISELVQIKNFNALLSAAGWVIFLLVSITQKLAPDDKKPWSLLLKSIGKEINKDVIQKQEELQDYIGEIERKLDNHAKMSAANDALMARRRIIKGSDELRVGKEHSEEWFNDILSDIQVYKQYCHDHLDFQNDKATTACERIVETYRHCLDKNNFL